MQKIKKEALDFCLYLTNEKNQLELLLVVYNNKIKLEVTTMGKLYFTSDTHFNQQRTLEMSKRPFKDVKEMNNVLVSNWNKIIKPEDIVYHLGDFGDYRMREFLNGKIVLVKGNYERSGYKEEYEKYSHELHQINEHIFAILLVK